MPQGMRIHPPEPPLRKGGKMSRAGPVPFPPLRRGGQGGWSPLRKGGQGGSWLRTSSACDPTVKRSSLFEESLQLGRWGLGLHLLDEPLPFLKIGVDFLLMVVVVGQGRMDL